MDRSLVEQAQRGDREAFTRIAFELSDRLFAVAQRILRDFDVAGDALQGEDAVGARELAEPQGHHVRARHHVDILAPRTDICRVSGPG